MICDFNKNENDQNEEAVICIGEHILEPKESFRYLGSVIHKSGRIEDDVTHHIQAGWLKWRAATGILYDKNVPLKLKEKFYRVAIQPTMLYGRVETIFINGVRRRGRPKLRWEDRLKTDLKELLLSEDMTSNRNSWRTRIRGLYVSFAYVPRVFLHLCAFCAFMLVCSLDHVSVFLEAVPLSLGKGVTVYIPPPSYLALAGLGTVVVVVLAVVILLDPSFDAILGECGLMLALDQKSYRFLKTLQRMSMVDMVEDLAGKIKLFDFILGSKAKLEEHNRSVKVEIALTELLATNEQAKSAAYFTANNDVGSSPNNAFSKLDLHAHDKTSPPGPFDGKQPELKNHVGVGGYDYPAFISLNIKNGAYAPLKSAFEGEQIMCGYCLRKSFGIRNMTWISTAAKMF
ncbi:hypothetical protein Tco_0875640 [Tanacetum coccineum]|uniref:Uncharacterized protein n=1 Tax=Tanacetum coccineum TaxID=301880 RepID=A0ABQ5BV09_9ASTR